MPIQRRVSGSGLFPSWRTCDLPISHLVQSQSSVNHSRMKQEERMTHSLAGHAQAGEPPLPSLQCYPALCSSPRCGVHLPLSQSRSAAPVAHPMAHSAKALPSLQREFPLSLSSEPQNGHWDREDPADPRITGPPSPHLTSSGSPPSNSHNQQHHDRTSHGQPAPPSKRAGEPGSPTQLADGEGESYPRPA